MPLDDRAALRSSVWVAEGPFWEGFLLDGKKGMSPHLGEDVSAP